MKKRYKGLVLFALMAAVGAVQAADIHWKGSINGSTDVNWTNPVNWFNNNSVPAGAEEVPVAGDVVILQRYIFGADSLDAIISPVLDAATPALTMVIVAWQPTAGPVQTGQLDMVNGANLQSANIQMCNAAGSTATLNMSGNAHLAANGFWVGNAVGSTSTINMGEASTFLVNITMFWGQDSALGTGSIIMDGGATLQVHTGDPAWANERITALGAGESISATDIGGEIIEYTVIPVEPFAAFTAANLIPNGDFSSTSNGTGGLPANLIGSNGDFPPFAGNTIDVVGWVPYFSDPSNLVAKTGSGGVLDETFYLDTLFNNNITLNSSTYYLNGVVQSNALDGVLINPAASYELSIEVGATQYPNSQPTNAIFTFALTAGTDVSNTNNAIANALVQIDEATLPAVGGTRPTTVVSGADLVAAMNSGPVNVLFNHLSELVIPNYPAVVSPDHQNPDYNAQISVFDISLIVVVSAGDVNKDGLVNFADVDIAQLYLAGDGGEPAVDRQNALIALGRTPAEALAALNLTDFDMNGDDFFDAADVAAIAALVPPLVIQIAANGAVFDFVWTSNIGKQYDLESSSSLMFPGWAVYNDGAATYGNIPASGTGSNILSGVLDVGPVRFFRIIEK